MIITSEPTFSTKDLKKMGVRVLTNKVFKARTTFTSTYLMVAGIIYAILLLLLALNDFKIGNPYEDGIGMGAIMFTLIFVIAPLFFILYGLLTPRKHLVLNRMNGTISIPPRFWGKPNVVPFDICVGAITESPSGGGSYPMLEIWPNDEYRKGGIAHLDRKRSGLIEYWSLLVWYMDKNRPLPPCKELDSFRDRDFERRKAEGFPLPLYLSHIDTPEATPEQQRERDKHWPKNLAGKMPPLR
jgi:hypothetical protein